MAKKRRQITLNVYDRKICIVSFPRTHLRNFIGYNVTVSDDQGHKETYRIMNLDRSQAEASAYAKFVKDFC